MMANDQYEAGLLTIIDTEEKQLQAISDLYQIIKAQPKYRKLKEPSWQAETSPLPILHWILRKLGPLAEGNRWTVDTYKEGRKIRYCFIIYRYYHSQELRCQEEYIPLDFLPALRKRDEPLHNLIIDLVALVSRQNKIPLWDEDGDYSFQLEDVRTWKIPSGNHVLDQQVFSYSKGPAAQYLQIINRRKKVITDLGVGLDIERYEDTSGRKRLIKWWLRMGLRLAMRKDNIQKYSYVPHHIIGNPISPFRQYKFVWSIHKNDIVACKASDKLKKDAKSGDLYPVMFTTARPGQRLKPLPDDYLWDFPLHLYRFMYEGLSCFCGRYRDYFYKNQLAEQQTPAEAFLEKIERTEISVTI